MTKRNQIWKCEVCGNIVEVLHEGADALVCCGESMILMKENSVDAAVEKHVPVIEGKVVKVGSVAHPMGEDHYIEWIEAGSDSGFAPCKKFLESGDKAEVEFPFKVGSARVYCNLHGLWVSD
jgi:superoxide reductase